MTRKSSHSSLTEDLDAEQKKPLSVDGGRGDSQQQQQQQQRPRAGSSEISQHRASPSDHLRASTLDFQQSLEIHEQKVREMVLRLPCSEEA